MYYLMTFENTHTAIQTKKTLKVHLPLRTVPVLREISASCGIALRIEPAYFERLSDFLRTSGLAPAHYALYAVETATTGGKGLKIKKLAPDN
ncbi:MAG: DUF3343 domain-containing protein [Eubacteriales bacterium]|nr:DUF3343 domain-containing protein [Eubacteriales bacterium]